MAIGHFNRGRHQTAPRKCDQWGAGSHGLRLCLGCRRARHPWGDSGALPHRHRRRRRGFPWFIQDAAAGTQWLLPSSGPRRSGNHPVGLWAADAFFLLCFLLFPFSFFLFHLSVSSQIWARARAMGSFVWAVADSWLAASRAVMTRVKAEPNRQPIRKILSFSFSFPPNLGYLFCQPATKVGRGAVQLIRRSATRSRRTPGALPGAECDLVLALHLCPGAEEALQIGGAGEALQVGAGARKDKRRRGQSGSV